MAESVHLLEVEPDLGRFMAAEDFGHAQALRVPVLTIGRGGFDLRVRLAEHGAYGALVLEGMVMQRMRLANQITMKLQGPGDLLGRILAPSSSLITDWSFSSTTGTRLALLGADVLMAVRRWPALAAGIHVRTMEQAERLAVQLAICQLPRVDDRVLALLWWLAETWGKVTSSGTLVPLSMTHDVLGALVGARRPTVTLALGELVQRGALVRQDRGWLLLEPPPRPDREPSPFDDPALLPSDTGEWRSGRVPDAELLSTTRAELLATIERLREQYAGRTQVMHERLEELRRIRASVGEARAAREHALTLRRAPSSQSRRPPRARPGREEEA